MVEQVKSGPNTSAGTQIARIQIEGSVKSKVYTALKDAVINMDVYAASEPIMLDERGLSDQLGVSRTPIREAVAMLEQDGFLRTVPRRGILVVRKSKTEVIDMIRAWAALESMAVRMIAENQTADVTALRKLFKDFSTDHKPKEHLSEYSSANIAFHQALIRMSGSRILADMTDNILLHVRGIRQLTIGAENRAARSIKDHFAIISAIEAHDVEKAARLSLQHTLGLAAFVELQGDYLFALDPTSVIASGAKQPRGRRTPIAAMAPGLLRLRLAMTDVIATRRRLAMCDQLQSPSLRAVAKPPGSRWTPIAPVAPGLLRLRLV